MKEVLGIERTEIKGRRAKNQPVKLEAAVGYRRAEKLRKTRAPVKNVRNITTALKKFPKNHPRRIFKEARDFGRGYFYEIGG